MIEFRCSKVSMKHSSKSAQLFSFGSKNIWVPKSKLLIKEDPIADDYNICIMPKWAFYKTNNLSDYVEVLDETQHLETIENI